MTKPTIEARFMRPAQAAFYSGVCQRTFADWQASGLIPRRKIGRTVLIDRAELDAALDKFLVAGPRPAKRRMLRQGEGS